MAFRFGQRRVADPLAQQNFEQLEGLLPLAAGMLADGIDLKVTGPVAGNGGAIGSGATALPGLSMTYTTGDAAQTRAIIQCMARVDVSAAVWQFQYMGLGVSPAPIGKWKLNAVAGVTPNVGYALDGGFAFGGAAGCAWLEGWDLAVLAPNTTYTFQVYASNSVAGGSWNVLAENSMLGVFSPIFRPAP